MPKQKKKSQQSFLQGALTLMFGTLIVKVVSLLFKIPITNMLSEAAMSYFENAYTFFTLFSTLASAGFPVAISKIVAENNVQGKYADTRKILRLSLMLFLGTGLFFSFLMFIGAGQFAMLIKNDGAALSIMALSPAVFFLCMMSAYRGYYQGLRNMVPTATSQVIEAVVKLLCGVLFTSVALTLCRSEFAVNGTVLGKAYASQSAADIAIYQVGSAAALIGVVVSTAAGFIYLSLRHKFVGDGIERSQIFASPKPEEGSKMLRYIMQLSIPICLGSLALNVSSMIDMTTVLDRLSHAVEQSPEIVRKMYGSAIPTDMVDNMVPAHLYGAYTSIAVTISNIVPAAATGFGVSALPIVSDAWARHSRRDISKGINTVLRITSLFCVPCGIGLWMLADPICKLFFSRPMGVAIAAPTLRILGLASIFTSLVLSLNSLLQAIGKVSVPVRMVIMGAVVKLVLNYTLVGIPGINLQAVPYGTLLSYILITLMSMYVIQETTHVRISVFSLLWKPVIAAVICGFTAAVTYDSISTLWESRFAVIPAIAVGAVVYAFGIVFLKAVKKEDILMLPKGEKVVKILEKCGLIG